MSKKRVIKKQCGRCRQPKTINCFGICRARKDGRNLYCKPCILDIVHAQRNRKREMKKARNEARTRAQETAVRDLAEFDRKPNVLSPFVQPPVTKVRVAIEAGHTTQERIRTATKLSRDEISDSLAELMLVEKEVGYRRIDGEPVYFVRRKVAA